MTELITVLPPAIAALAIVAAAAVAVHRLVRGNKGTASE
jgi:hypothetical protein